MIIKKKVMAVVLAIAMTASLMPSGFGTKGVKAADTWRSELYPENWQPGYTNSKGQFLHDFSYAGYEKGEKDVPTQMSGMTADVTTYGADATGTNDSTSAIQSAIDAVQNAGGGTVYLPEGTYKVKPSGEGASALTIKGSNIIFKGAGKGKTFIRCYAENMRNCTVIKVSNGGNWDSAEDGKTYYLSQDIPETPTNIIHLNDLGNLKVGDWVIIRSDRTKDWINDHSMSGFWGENVSPTTMGTTFYRKITSVNTADKTIEIDIPTRYWMKTRDNARVYKVTPKQSNVGLMDFSIGNKANTTANGWGEEDYKTAGNGGYQVHNAFLIKFSLNINCFAKNISTYQAGNSSQIHMSSNGLDLSKTRNATIENCDFSYPQYEGGGGNGYGMNICGQETLIKNCSSTSARHSFSFKYAYANGNVIYHYTSTDPKYGSDFHMYLSMSNLIDNEELNGDFVETNVRPYGGTAGNRHGYTSTQTVFWNTKGNRYKSGMNYIIDSRQFGYGYIIGTQGAATAVKTTPTTMSSQYGSINTAPEDYKEGIGTAATLYPQSLYYDQLAKRLEREIEEPEIKTHTIPGSFNATDYSTITSGITKNTTAAGVNYIGNLTAQSAIEYKTNIEKTGKYKLDVNAVAGNSNSTRTLSVYLDDKLITNLTVINKTDWEDFQTLSANVDVPELENHTLKIVSSGSTNISDIKLTKIADTIPGSVSIGAYTTKSDEIKISTNDGVMLAGNLINGSYIEYTVNATKTGKYNMLMDLATVNDGRTLTISLDGNNVGTVLPSATSTWFAFKNYKLPLTIQTTGEHKIRITTTGSCNISNLAFEENNTQVPTTPSNTKFGNNYKVIAYYPNWSGNITSKVQWDKLTHVYYAFGLPNAGGYMESIDGQTNNISAMVTAAHNNDVKATLSVGGWSYSDGSRCSTVFENATNTDAKCKSLADSIVAAAVKHKFDGVDIDWEYPTNSSATQYAKFITYLKENCTKNGLEMTAAVAAMSGTGFTTDVLNKFDFINIMAYDGDAGSGHSPYSMVENCYNYWHNTKKVASDKIVMGVPFYERPNWASYADIVKADKANAQKDSAVINGTTVYYNGIPTMKKKAEYAAKNCGGIMIWEISQDTTNKNLSLLSAIYDTTIPIVGKGENTGENETTTKVVETTTTKPVETTTKVVETMTTKPVETTTKVVETTTKKPVETTTKAVETTTKKPVETTTKAVETTTKTVETTTKKQAETTTKTVETTTKKPVETTTKVVETTTKKPVETTTKAVETTTKKPVETTTKTVETTTTKPVETTTKAEETTTKKPVETTTKAVETTTKKPAEATTIKENTSINTTTQAPTNSVTETTVKEKSGADIVEEEIINSTNDKDSSDSTFGKLQVKAKKSAKTSIKIAWRKATGATQYVIYGAKCGTPYKKIAILKNAYFIHKKLNKGTYYKYMVVAQNEKGDVLAISKLIHETTKGGKFSNCKKIKLNKANIKLKVNKKFRIKVIQIAEKQKAKIKKHRKISFESENPEVATVSKKGVIVAKKKGKCLIYVYAQNGVYRKVKVTVK